jgi:anti-anti-sigma factor
MSLGSVSSSVLGARVRSLGRDRPRSPACARVRLTGALAAADTHEEPVIASAISDPAGFSMSIAAEGDDTVVALFGELDIATTELVHNQVADLRRAGIENFVLDLRGLTFMDGRGLQMLLVLRNAARRAGRPFSLVPGSPAVQRVFALTATSTLFDWRTVHFSRRMHLQRLQVKTRAESIRRRQAELRVIRRGRLRAPRRC